MTRLTNLGYCTHRYAMFVSYLGTKYNGSQRLTSRNSFGDQNTIQEAIEWSLENFLPKKRCRITTSSRTDKGVHALMNCYTLPLMDCNLPTERFKRMANEHLLRKNHDIVVNEVMFVPTEFHPRRAVVSREYIYRIAVAKKLRSTSLSRDFSPFEMVHLLPVTELYKVLPIPCFDLDRATEVMELLRGEHDFASFSFKPTDPNDTVRNMEISMKEVEHHRITPNSYTPFRMYHIHFKSRSFLHNQIRRIVGAIVSYATYQSVTLNDIRALLQNPSPLSWTGNLLIAEPWGLFLSRLNFDPNAFRGSIKTRDDETIEEVSEPCSESDDSW